MEILIKCDCGNKIKLKANKDNLIDSVEIEEYFIIYKNRNDIAIKCENCGEGITIL